MCKRGALSSGNEAIAGQNLGRALSHAYRGCILRGMRCLHFDNIVLSNTRMGTDKTHVGFVSENRHDFVGFCRFFPTDTNRHKFFHKPTRCRFFVGFLSVFCRFRARIFNKTRQNFDIFRTSLWCLETENYKIVINKRLNLLFNLRVHLLSLFIEF